MMINLKFKNWVTRSQPKDDKNSEFSGIFNIAHAFSPSNVIEIPNL